MNTSSYDGLCIKVNVGEGTKGQLVKAKTVFLLALVLPLLVGCDKGSEKTADKDNADTAQDQVVISAEDVEHLGIATAPVQAVQYVPDVRGFGAVTSFDALAQSISDVTTAQAAAEQSQAALQHAKSLFTDQLITRDALALAERQAATDAAQVLLAERKQAVAFGRNAPWRTKGESDAIFAQLASGHLVLVHVSFPSGTPSQQVPQTLTVRRGGEVIGSVSPPEAGWENEWHVALPIKVDEGPVEIAIEAQQHAVFEGDNTPRYIALLGVSLRADPFIVS